MGSKVIAFWSFWTGIYGEQIKRDKNSSHVTKASPTTTTTTRGSVASNEGNDSLHSGLISTVYKLCMEI